jgi:hypothetical protein
MGVNGYDIIGDIHGYADKLHNLLEKLGYKKIDGVFGHPTRKVIFLGDFIDRGPQQKQVMDTVMGMVDQQQALAVMGNHELNALAYHTVDPNTPKDEPERHLRRHTDKNTKQHQAFIDAYGIDTKNPELRRVLDFFYSLPLWLELDGLRIIHACWHSESIKHLTGLLGTNNTLSPELLADGSRAGTPEYDAIEILLKGPETSIPDDGHFTDKDGTRRIRVRLAWWMAPPTSWSDATLPPNIITGSLADKAVPSELGMGYSLESPPVLFGHYWFSGQPTPLAPNTACLDYSVANGGKLCAYRWSGESTLSKRNFLYV